MLSAVVADFFFFVLMIQPDELDVNPSGLSVSHVTLSVQEMNGISFTSTALDNSAGCA